MAPNDKTVFSAALICVEIIAGDWAAVSKTHCQETVLYSEHGFSMPWTVLGDPQGNVKLNMRMLISYIGDFPLIQGT